MAFTKVYNGAGSGATAGDYSDSRNWELISVRSPAWTWTASGSGTGEFYLRTAASGDPGFAASPPQTNGVYVNGSAFTYSASLGSLAASRWGYGDNDTLGYSTVYVRLSDDADPDSKAADFVAFRQIPQTGERVIIPATAGDISSGLDQSAVAITDFIRDEGHSGTIAAKTGFLLIDPNYFEDNGREQAHIDIGAANINCVLNSSASAADGTFGLYLRGSNIALLDVRGGLNAVAIQGGETSTVSKVVTKDGSSGIVALGRGVTLDDVVMFGGEAWIHCTGDDVTLYGGRLYLRESAALDAVTMWGGEFSYGSSGNIATVNIYGGTFDERASNIARTIAAFNKFRGSYQIHRNKEAVTHTAETAQQSYSEAVS